MEHSKPPYCTPVNHASASDVLNVSHNMNGSAEAAASTAATVPAEHDRQSSTLDHALLESLFYNEMMMLNAQSPTSSNTISQQLREATTYPTSESPLPATSDANAIAEKEMLRDFGVTASPMMLQVPPTPKTDTWTAVETRTAPVNPMVVQSQSNGSATATISRHASISSLTPQRAPLLLDPSVTTSASRPLQPKPRHTTAAVAPALSVEPPVSVNRGKQLVDQFATLASRLGIDLPSNVLQQLTTVAAKNDRSAPATPEIMNNIRPNHTANLKSENPQAMKAPYPSGVNGTSGHATVAPTVEELQKTAEQAIAAATRKRPPDEQKDPANSSNNKPLYSKRRKKPRLSDCEQKLAQLKAENEVLKLHLQNVSNKANQIEKGKEESARRLKQMHDDNAGPEEMNTVIKQMTDMYSDYGTNRQQELAFHLEQLSRLVVPTNFTKLGLWTLGQSSPNPKRNPIAGILQKELDITPQQGRKIVEQSEKITAVCDNLKECLALLAKLKSLCEQKTQIFHDRMAYCREILTPKQTAKLIMWINEHYQLLDQICPGWGTEHIH